MFRIINLLIVYLLFSFGCENSESSSKSVQGGDDRVKSDSYSNQDSIGWISQNFEDTSIPLCTAFVSGIREITTSLHCFSTMDGLYNITYNTMTGKSIEVYKIISAYSNADVVRLGITDDLQIIEEAEFDSSQESKLVSFNLQEGLQEETKLIAVLNEEGYIVHQLDTERGASGGPILQQFILVA